MKRIFVIVLIALRSLSFASDVQQWSRLCRGIDFIMYKSQEPVLQAVYAVRVDLQDKSLYFFTTPDNGERPFETDTQTTGAFLTQYKLALAVNANFFNPCCSKDVQPVDLLGYAVSSGRLVSENLQIAEDSGVAEVPVQGSAVMMITKDNKVSFSRCDSDEMPALMKNAYNAVTGGPVLLKKGTNLIEEPDDAVRHPRTAAGTSKDGRYLYFVVIDGRQKGYSDGANLKETAEWLLKIGAYDGINLDGGGSSSLVWIGEEETPVTLNKPSGGAQRLVGNNIGIGIRQD
ncbi:MAG: phosphodiester glycosidase family protein [Phycisphaerae bacterium]|jgi:exopolysaccharide biosynthesis protein